MRPPLPDSFQDRLDSMFDGRLRIRWSYKKHEWHIEYKIARGKTFKYRRYHSEDDAIIRAIDGYALVMAVQPGDRMPCPKCGYTLRVPVFEIAETVCDYCRVQGKDGRVTACYFPLDGEAIFEHLRKFDPLRGWRDGMHTRADEHNQRILAAKERDTLNKIEAATKENWRDLVGIQSVGYTGKEFKGHDSAT